MSNTHDKRTWAMARRDYDKGVNVGALCANYDIPRSTFYARARREGWLRADEAREAELNGELSPLPDAAPPCRDLARLALDRAADALFKGDLHAAEGWARLARRFRDLAVGETAYTANWTDVLRREEREAEKAQAVAETAPDETGLDTNRDTAEAENTSESETSATRLDSPASPMPPPLSSLDPEATLAALEAALAETPELKRLWRRSAPQHPDRWLDDLDDDEDEPDP